MDLYNPFNGKKIVGTEGAQKEETPSVEESIIRKQNEIRLAEAYFKKNFWKRADRMVKLYELDHYYSDNGMPDNNMLDRIKVPHGYADARQLLAELLVKLPEPIVKPKRVDKLSLAQPSDAMAVGADPAAMMPPAPGSGVMDQPAPFVPMQSVLGSEGQPMQVNVEKGATKLKSSIIYIRDESNMKRSTRQMTLDGVVTGLGVVMINAVKGSKVPRYDRKIYKNILWDRSYGNPYDSPWHAERIETRTEVVRSDERYNKEVREKVTSNRKMEDEYTQNIIDTYGQFGFTTVWSYWDRRTNQHCMWAEGMTEYLLEETITDKFPFKIEEDEFVCDTPYFFFIDEEMITEGWGMGSILPQESQIREKDKVRTYMIRHLSRFNRKYGVAKKLLDEQGRNALRNGADGTIVEFNDDSWQAKFMPIQDAPIPNDIYTVGNIIDQDRQTISPTGPTSLTRGVGQKPDTLGEAQIIEENTGTRLSEKQDQLSEVFRRIFRITAQFVQMYWAEEDVLRVTGDGTKATDWLTFSPEDVMGEYTYDVDPESFKDNTAVYRKQNAEALQIAAPLLGQVGQTAGIFIILKQYLSTFPTLERYIDDIVPEQLTQQAPMGMPSGNEARSPEEQELLDVIEQNGEDAVVDMVNKLPENERNSIIQAIQKLQGSVAAPSAPQPNMMQSAASRV